MTPGVNVHYRLHSYQSNHWTGKLNTLDYDWGSSITVWGHLNVLWVDNSLLITVLCLKYQNIFGLVWEPSIPDYRGVLSTPLTLCPSCLLSGCLSLGKTPFRPNTSVHYGGGRSRVDRWYRVQVPFWCTEPLTLDGTPQWIKLGNHGWRSLHYFFSTPGVWRRSNLIWKDWHTQNILGVSKN